MGMLHHESMSLGLFGPCIWPYLLRQQPNDDDAPWTRAHLPLSSPALALCPSSSLVQLSVV